MVGGEEVQETFTNEDTKKEEEEADIQQTLTNEDTKKEEESDVQQTLTNEDTKKEEEEADVEGDALVVLLKRTIDTIMMEEFFDTNRKMNLFRNVLVQGVLTFAEKHEGDTAKMDLFVDSFRAAWKTFKQHGDHEKTMDVFMKTMNFGSRKTRRLDCTRDLVVLLF